MKEKLRYLIFTITKIYLTHTYLYKGSEVAIRLFGTLPISNLVSQKSISAL